MNVHTARAMFTTDRLDWNRSHLNWVPGFLYRLRREVAGAKR